MENTKKPLGQAKKVERSQDHVESKRQEVFLERIPDRVYEELVDLLSEKYHFVNGPENGGRMRLAEYFLGIRKTTAEHFLGFIRQIIERAQMKRFPAPQIPAGFASHSSNLLPLEQQGGFSFGYFDAAVTEEGLQLIELDAFTTYHMTAAKMSHFLQERLCLPGSSVFVNEPAADWETFISLVQDVIAGEQQEGIVLTDRALETQKTSFEFYATQVELEKKIDIVDSRLIFEEEGQLFYRMSDTDDAEQIKPLRRLYNRVLVLEAMVEDNYPHNSEKWNFRFDKAYAGMKFVNHPFRMVDISKRVLPYVSHPFNPPCYELIEVADQFRDGKMAFSDYVWKHKLGSAGRSNILLPNATILSELTKASTLSEYIAQRKVDFERFYTADGQEKIVELRFITVQSLDKLLVVPMARIGHAQENENGQVVYRIHFGDNNMYGYGLCPVIIFDE